MLSDRDLQTRRETAETMLRDAGREALAACLSRDFTVEAKGHQDFVTAIDRRTEDRLRAALARAFPQDAVLGEEGGGAPGPVTWILDPIDGTANFLRGFPYWCLSAGLVADGDPVMGVIYDPCRDELFSAHRGGGATLNGARMRVAETGGIDRATFGLGFSFRTPAQQHAAVIGEILQMGGTYRMPGAGALTLAHLAAGRLDGFWEASIHPWDVAAGLAILAEAGGIATPYGRQSGWRAPAPLLALTPAMAQALAGGLPRDAVWSVPLQQLQSG
ncbi:inositol monophosphatase family protein [Mangrovicoccus algicola]|uniref:Inositol-1-monophosphatase n=1 Tax=Mangrovicoccus algicola TaxID=2771008 RepID=A0A8J6YW54_9RHOB|nr:inositol monophosphatase family protein [Mangrovicoccus algicola]MBE3637324.1 inositol monophosphatase [Mangrovicoccus algicola]